MRNAFPRFLTDAHSRVVAGHLGGAETAWENRGAWVRSVPVLASGGCYSNVKHQWSQPVRSQKEETVAPGAASGLRALPNCSGGCAPGALDRRLALTSKPLRINGKAEGKNFLNPCD